MDPEIPEVGEVVDGYRFKGGDPAEEASWEQVAPIDVSGQYGAGARQLPNGVIERVGPRGGVTVISRPGAAAGSPAAFGADSRARVAINIDPLIESQGVFDRMDAGGYNPSSGRNLLAAGLEAIPFDAGYAARVAGGEDYNAYQQALKTFEAALLPIMSGAAVTPTEAQRLIRAALPQPGDSPEVLEQKARQRRQMVNAAALGIGREAPFPDVGQSTFSRAGPINSATGLPTYPGITALQRGVTDAPLTETERSRVSLPGSSPDTAIDVTNRDALLSAGAGAYVRFPDGTVERLSGAPVVGEATGDQVANGVFANRTTPEEAVAARDAANPVLRQIDAGVRGAADALSFGFADEIAAGANALIPLDRGSASVWQGKSFGDAYDENVAMQRGIDRADERDAGAARLTGQVLGGVAGGVGGGARLAGTSVGRGLALRQAVPGATRGANITRRVGNTARLAAGGAAAGGAYGAGSAEGNIIERVPNALQGAALGALAAPVLNTVATPIIGAVDRAVRNVGANALEQGLSKWSGRAVGGLRPSPNVLAARVAEQEAMGLRPAFVDAIDDGDLGVVKALNARNTDARDAGQRFSRDRRIEAQGNLSDLSRRYISDDIRPAAQVADDLDIDQRTLSAQEYGAARAAPPVRVQPDIAEALLAGEGRAAMRDASRLYASSTNPDERALGAELGRLAGATDTANGLEMSVGAADLVARYLGRAGGTDQNRQRIFGNLGGAVRQAARDQSGEYDAAVSGFADRASLNDALTFGRGFAARKGTGDFAYQAGRMTEPQRAVARVSARDAVEDAAAVPSTAATMLDTLAVGRGSGITADALLDDPAGLARTADAMSRRVEVGRRVDPRFGSPTNLNGQDEELVSGATAFARRPISTSIQWAANSLARRGFNNQQAEALATAVMDPNRTQEVIGILSRRMTRRQAHNLVRSVRFNAAQAAGQYAGDE